MCSISGYGQGDDTAQSTEYEQMKAYDLLVQAEVGLCAITGTEEGPARVGVSLCDIATGLTAYSAILRALLARAKTGDGTHIQTSLFGVMADWMNVPLLHQAYGGQAPRRMGICHPSIAPYGAFSAGDGRQLVISIQNEREWTLLCGQVLDCPKLAEDPLFVSNIERVKNREILDEELARRFAEFSQHELARRLLDAGIAYGRLNAPADVLLHPQLRHITVDSPSGELSLVAAGTCFEGQATPRLPVPSLGQHSEAVRREFNRLEGGSSRPGDTMNE
jgi:crotonobetainyl-CoA:carnitine CoA-transferase CaiB-like acyl-CoA transferase